MNVQLLLMTTLVLSISVSGCATRQEFQQFAKVGGSYANTIPPLLNAGCKSQVDNSSWQLIIDREDAGGKITENSLNKLDVLDKKRCTILGRLSNHSAMLGEYFRIMNQLSSSEIGGEIGAEVDMIFGQVNAIGTQLRGEPLFANFPALQNVVEVIVNQRISAALRDELNKRKNTLREEFQTQEVLLEKLAQQMTNTIQLTQNLKYQKYVQEPLVDGTTLREDKLVAVRNAQLTRSRTIEGLKSASDAAKKARETFEQLISGKVSGEVMIARINALNADIEILRATVITLSNQ